MTSIDALVNEWAAKKDDLSKKLVDFAQDYFPEEDKHLVSLSTMVRAMHEAYFSLLYSIAHDANVSADGLDFIEALAGDAAKSIVRGAFDNAKE